jgi:hypothetical protein
MQDAHYLRSQATLCLQMADKMSDARVADKFRDAAADYFARAGKAERDHETQPSKLGSNDTPDDA